MTGSVGTSLCWRAAIDASVELHMLGCTIAIIRGVDGQGHTFWTFGSWDDRSFRATKKAPPSATRAPMPIKPTFTPSFIPVCGCSTCGRTCKQRGRILKSFFGLQNPGMCFLKPLISRGCSGVFDPVILGDSHKSIF